MKKMLLVFLFATFLQNCSLQDTFIHPIPVLGSWKLTEFKFHSDSSWKPVNTDLTVHFQLNGSIKYDRTDKTSYFSYELFNGGWCNEAEKYNIKGNRIYFKFSKANCIPFINPNTPEFSTILQSSRKKLVIEWWGKF